MYSQLARHRDSIRIVQCKYCKGQFDVETRTRNSGSSRRYYAAGDEFEKWLDDLIKNLNYELYWFQIDFLNFESEETLRTVKCGTLKALEDSLKSRTQLLKVDKLFLEVTDMEQARSICMYIDEKFLTSLQLTIKNGKEKIDIVGINFLVDWSKNERLDLTLRMTTMSLENLETINKLFLHISVFREIELLYNYCELYAWTFFDVKYDRPASSKYGTSLRFTLSPSFFLGPSLVRLTLSNETSAKVLENPDIMERIAKYLKLDDIESLRKTSCGIRNCVPYVKPDIFVSTYQLALISNNEISAEVCIASRLKGFPKTQFSENNQSTILHDFERKTQNQKRCMGKLKLTLSQHKETTSMNTPKSLDALIMKSLDPVTSQFLEQFKQILIKRHEPLKVCNLSLHGARLGDVMQVLPYLDPESMESLTIWDPFSDFRQQFEDRRDMLKLPFDDCPSSWKIPFDVEEMAKMEHWKNATELEIRAGMISTDIQKMNLLHFRRAHIQHVARITSEDIAYLKENLIVPPNPYEFTIHYLELSEDADLDEVMGQQHRMSIFRSNAKIWYLPIQDSPNSLRIFLDLDRKTISFGIEYPWRGLRIPD